MRNIISVALWSALITSTAFYLIAGIALNGTFLLVIISGLALVADLLQRETRAQLPASTHASLGRNHYRSQR